MLEEDENFINNKKQKKQLMAFSQKIEEIISEYKNRKKFGIPKIKEDNLQKVDLKQYNEFLEQIEEHKTIVNKYKIKLNNDDKFNEITQKEDELKYLKNEFKIKEKEYKYLLESNKKLNGFQNNLFDEEIVYYEDEVKKLKDDIFLKNKEFIKYNDGIKIIREEINDLEKEYDLVHKNIEFKKFEMTLDKSLKSNNNNVEGVKMAINISKNQLENIQKNYDKEKEKKDLLEKEVIQLRNILSQYQYQAHINDLKMKEIEKIEKEINFKNKEKNRINYLKKEEENAKKMRTKKMKNLMAESFKTNFPFKNNYKLLLEEEKKQKIQKPKILITKNKMKNSLSSMDIFNSKREEMKIKREKERQEFMSNLDKELKSYEEQKGQTIQEIKLLRDEIEKSLQSDKIDDKYIDNFKKEKDQKDLQ